MGAFFESPPPPPRPEPERIDVPEWFGPPRGTLPGALALDLVLARTDRVAVCITRIGAYPTGFEFDLRTFAAVVDEELDPLLFEGRRRHRGGLPPEMLRVGVQFADGRKATNVSEDYGGERPDGPVLNSHGGGGGGGDWHQTMWVWPLPPAGPLVFACEWPQVGIALTRHELDAQVVRDAAGRAQALFPSH
jgi:hypothetical protein